MNFAIVLLWNRITSGIRIMRGTAKNLSMLVSGRGGLWVSLTFPENT